MTTLGLQDRHYQALRRLLRLYLPEAEIWAYGSRARGDHRDGSDLDLVARNPRDLDEPQPPAFDRLRAALVDSDIPIVVELRDWARVPEAFHGAMARDAVVVQEPRHETRPQAKAPSAQEIHP